MGYMFFQIIYAFIWIKKICMDKLNVKCVHFEAVMAYYILLLLLLHIAFPEERNMQ